MSQSRLPKPTPRLYAVGEAADAVGVSQQTLRIWERKGLISPQRTPGGQRRFTAQDIEAAKHVANVRRRYGWNVAAIRGQADFVERRGVSSDLALAGRVRAVRREVGLPQRDAAARAGISRSHLAALERGESPISLDVMSRLCEAYGVPMTAFNPNTVSDEVVVRADERPRAILADGVVWEELAAPRQDMEPSHIVVPPGGGTNSEYERPGATFVLVLEGVLSLFLPGREFDLGPGDSAMVPAKTSWRWANEGDRVVRAIYVEDTASH